MRLTFYKDAVMLVLDASKRAAEHEMVDDDPATARPGLKLVAGDGICLMSNSTEHWAVVSYAIECDPRSKADEWLAVKRASFGPGSGVRFIAAEEVEGPLEASRAFLIVDLTPTSIRILSDREPGKEEDR